MLLHRSRDPLQKPFARFLVHPRQPPDQDVGDCVDRIRVHFFDVAEICGVETGGAQENIWTRCVWFNICEEKNMIETRFVVPW